MRQFNGVVVEITDESATLEIDGNGRRDVALPEHIDVRVGMRVRMIDTGRR